MASLKSSRIALNACPPATELKLEVSVAVCPDCQGLGAGQIQNSASHGELRACVDIGHGNTPKDTVHPVVVIGKD